MGYAIRHSQTGKYCIWSLVNVHGFSLCENELPYEFSDIGHAKAAITRAVKHSYGDEAIKTLCLELEIVELTIHRSFTTGETVFSQLFRANEI